MRRLLYILSFGLVVILTSCGNERPIPKSELPAYNDQLVINTLLNNQSNISIYVGTSANAYTDDVPTDYNNVDVSLQSSTSSVSLTYDAIAKRFVANRPATPGQSYTITVSDKSGVMPTATARTSMPEDLLNKKISYVENGGIDINGVPADELSVTWTDVAGTNYYVVHFYYYSESAALFVPFTFEKTDPTLASPETFELNDGGYLFTDKLFNGREKTMKVVAPGGIVAGNSDILYLIELQKVTSDYYNYITTLQKFRDQEDFQESGPFGSAVIVHNNINNGLGAFLATTISSDTIR